MKTRNKLLIAVAVAAAGAAGSVQADPTWGDGLNQEFFNNFENSYRLVDNCTASNPCFTVDPDNDPSGWAKTLSAGIPVTQTSVGFFDFDPASTTDAPIDNIIEGDVFAGILNVQNIDSGGGTVWFAAADDQFTGYFAQQVANIDFNEMGDIDHITLTTTADDPFDILNQGGATGEMVRLYADDGTPFESGGTTFDDIGKATDGDFWAALGLSAADANANGLADSTGDMTDGYAYSHVDLGLDFDNFSDQETFLALNVVTLGDAYNKGDLAPINDINEAEVGGSATPPITGTCNPVDANPFTCNQFVGTGELEGNSNSFLSGGTSPWLFASNDPLNNYRIRIPEPGTLALMGLGLFGLSRMRRFGKRS